MTSIPEAPTAPRAGVLLPATTPTAWLSSHLAARFDEHAEPTAAGSSGWSTVGDLLAGRAAVLRRIHDRLVTDEGVPPAAAATYTAGWTAGSLGDAVGFALATVAAGFVVDPAHARWHQHPDGWMDRVALDGCHVLVTAGHPWDGCDAVEVVSDDDVCGSEL